MPIPPWGSPPPYSKGDFTVKPTLSDHAVIGAEMLTAPTGFNNATNWTLGAGWTSTSGNTTATATAATSSLVATAANLSGIVAGNWYRVTFRLFSLTAGSMAVQLGGTFFTWTLALGSISPGGVVIVMIATDTTGLQFNATGLSGVLSTLSVKPITAANAPLIINDSGGSDAFELRTNGLAVASLGLGLNALRSNTLTTAANLSAIGLNALKKNLTGTGNLALGTNAMAENTTGNNDVALGLNASQAGVSGSGNVAIGASALSSNIKGNNNVAIGLNAGSGITNAANNTLIGAGAGASITTGQGNTCIGGVDVATPTTSNTVNIENVYFGDMSGLPKLAGIIVQAPKSVLDVGGAIATPIVAKAAPYTVTATDSTILASGTTTITLPTAVGIAGRHYTVKKTDVAGTSVTVAGNGIELIDGANTFVLSTQYASIEVQSDGTQWWITASH